MSAAREMAEALLHDANLEKRPPSMLVEAAKAYAMLDLATAIREQTSAQIRDASMARRDRLIGL